MKIKRKDLQPFCETSELRPKLMKPFRQHGFVCATDGHLLVRIPESQVERYTLVADLPPTGGQNVNTQAVIPDPVPQICESLTPELLAKAINKAPKIDEFTPCECCHGDGNVDWEYEDWDGNQYERWDECPVCHGSGHAEPTGKKVTDPDSLFVVCGHVLSYKEAQLLHQALAVCHLTTAYVREREKNAPLFLTADGIQIIVTTVIEEGCQHRKIKVL